MWNFTCSSCQATHKKWAGQCSSCREWNTLSEIVTHQLKHKNTSGTKKATQKLQPQKNAHLRIPVKSGELQTVLGGGIVPGSFVLLSGEPGIGKSTLTLQVAEWVASNQNPILYVSGEEDVDQIADRAHRLKTQSENIHFLHEQSIENILSTLESNTFPLVIIDSVSVLYSEKSGSGIGSIGQIRHIAEMCMEYAKRSKTTIIMIGHVTKDGDLAGPKTLEHLVDTVLFLEGSKHEEYRLLRTRKNRFGPTNEIGLFRMTDTGLLDVKNPGIEFLSEKQQIGSALGITMEGTRPIIVEIEALTHYTKFGYPKRSVRGMPSSKIDLLIAILNRFTNVHLEQDDVYINVSHGFQVSEPAIDLTAIAAIASSKSKIYLGKTIFIGETSLTGIIRPVQQIIKRLETLKKLGFKKVIIPTWNEKQVSKKNWGDLEVAYVKDVEEFIQKISK